MTDEKRLPILYAVFGNGRHCQSTISEKYANEQAERLKAVDETYQMSVVEYVPRASVCEPKSEFRVPVRSKSEFKRVEALGGNPVFAQPAPSPIDDVGRIGVPSVLVVASKLLECAESWEPECRLVGNVRADEIVSLCRAVLGITRGEDGKHG